MSEFKGFFRIQIRKEALKFSAAHLTVFPDGTKENLHGHNYRTVVKVEFEMHSLETMLPFSELKTAMRRICREWDEKILLAEKNPFGKILGQGPRDFETEICGKRYVFPADEVVLLPVDNITTESLARVFCERLVASLPRAELEKARVRSVETQIEEMLGQGASYVVEL